MKTVTHIVRTIFGALLLFGSIPYFLDLFPAPELSGNMKTFSDGLDAGIYLMPLVKSVELICGLAFILNRFVALATIVIFPVTLNILCVHIFLAPQGLPFALLLMIANLFLAFRNRMHYRGLFIVRTPLRADA